LGFDQPRDPIEPPLRGWRVVAGPPSLEARSDYYGSILDASKRHYSGHTMRRTPKGYTIECAHCGPEFESKGLRCC
jgi:hypothetical protein